MPAPTDRDRPEAGADTTQGRQGQGSKERQAESGGHRSTAGGTYGDYVPDRGQPRRTMDIDHDPVVMDDFVMGDSYTGGGNIEQPGKQPRDAPKAAEAAEQGSGEEGKRAAEREETIAEVNRNKGFDTPHVHSGTTSRKV
jgi:hypothetical protein